MARKKPLHAPCQVLKVYTVPVNRIVPEKNTVKISNLDLKKEHVSCVR